jgi:tetratricopeptide (TPR) repeat protein
MLAALDAAQKAGGDIRGKQSAALVVVSAAGTGKPWQDRMFDVRVDAHADPLSELRRLVAVNRAYNHMNAGDLAVEHGDAATALREYAAAEQIAATTHGIPRSRHAEMLYWHAVALVNMKRVDEALPLFARAFEMEPAWRELTLRLPRSGLLPDDDALIKRITMSQSVRREP